MAIVYRRLFTYNKIQIVSSAKQNCCKTHHLFMLPVQTVIIHYKSTRHALDQMQNIQISK